MATALPRTGAYTFDDFLAMVRPDQKADLLDGVIYMASPESTDHNKLGGWLYRLMSEYVERLDLGDVYYTRVAFRIGKRRGPEPDVAFVAKRRAHLIRRGFVDGAPDVAVEIVNPESAERDYERKRTIYERAGVREYWIVDPDMKKATFLQRYRGKLHEVAISNSVFESSMLKGFRLDTRWLWAKRRPSVLKLVQELLGS